MIGEEFSTRVKILNNFTTFKNFTVYSYVYKGNNPVSLGYDSNSSKWGAAYTANQVSLGIEPGSSTILDFKNMIEEGTELGTYNLRVRIKLDNKETDITKQIEIRAKTIAETIEQKQEQQTVSAINETKNETAPVKTITTVGSATGFVTARIPNHMLLFSPIAVLFNFFYSLLNH